MGWELKSSWTASKPLITKMRWRDFSSFCQVCDLLSSSWFFCQVCGTRCTLSPLIPQLSCQFNSLAPDRSISLGCWCSSFYLQISLTIFIRRCISIAVQFFILLSLSMEEIDGSQGFIIFSPCNGSNPSCLQHHSIGSLTGAFPPTGEIHMYR